MSSCCRWFVVFCCGLGLLASAGRAQPLPRARLYPDLQSRGYRVVFEDNFDSYKSLADVKRARVLKPDGTTASKWDFKDPNRYYWSRQEADYKNMDRNICISEENLVIVDDSTKPGNKFLLIKSTFHARPLVARNWQPQDTAYSPNNDLLVDAADSAATVRKPVRLHWDQPQPPVRPVFYRTTGFMQPLYYGEDNRNCDWVNGFRYGIFQVRCKLPRRPGVLAAFWVHSPGGICQTAACDRDPYFRGDWEIDGFETRNEGAGDRPSGRSFFSTIQPNALNGRQATSTYYDVAADAADVFHTYTFAWTPTGITWFIDGVETRTDDASRGTPYSVLTFFLSSHYAWNYDGSNDESTYGTEPRPWFTNPALNGPDVDFVIDWVKVWKPVNTASRWPAFKTPLRWQRTVLASVPASPPPPAGAEPAPPTDPTVSTTPTAPADPASPPATRVVAVGPVCRDQLRLYFTVAEGAGTRLYCAASQGGTWQVARTEAANVLRGSNLAMDPNSGNLFFAGQDHRIWLRTPGGELLPVDGGGSFVANATHEQQTLTYDGAPEAGGDASQAGYQRLYYATGDNDATLRTDQTGARQLWYLQWKAGEGWAQCNARLTNVAGSLAVVRGRVFYKGTDGNLWTYGFRPGAGWGGQRLNPGCYPADVDRLEGGVTFATDTHGDRVFYRSTANELKYYELTRYRQDVNLAQLPACVGDKEAYRDKFDECDADCLTDGKCPEWKLHATGNYRLADAPVVHFNNQLVFLNRATGAVQEYRHFKAPSGTRLVTSLEVSDVVPAGPEPALVQLFGQDDDHLYGLDAAGHVVRLTSSELLNPAPSRPEHPTAY